MKWEGWSEYISTQGIGSPSFGRKEEADCVTAWAKDGTEWPLQINQHDKSERKSTGAKLNGLKGKPSNANRCPLGRERFFISFLRSVSVQLRYSTSEIGAHTQKNISFPRVDFCALSIFRSA